MRLRRPATDRKNPGQLKALPKVALLVISPAKSDREEVIVAIHNAVAFGRQASLPYWMVPIMMLLPPRLQRHGLETGVAGTKVTVEPGQPRNNGNFAL